MIGKKKWRLILSELALSMLLPLPAFAADGNPQSQPQQQSESWEQTLGRWGSKAWDAGKPFLTHPIFLQASGTTLMALLLARYFSGDISNPSVNSIWSAAAISGIGAPLLAGYMHHRQRQKQKPEERFQRSPLITHLIYPLASGVTAGTAYALLLNSLKGGACSVPTAATVMAIAAIPAVYQGYSYAQQESKRDEFLGIKDALEDFIYNVIVNEQTFNKKILDDLTQKYDNLAKDLRSTEESGIVSSYAYVQLLVAKNLRNEEAITIQKQSYGNQDYYGAEISMPNKVRVNKVLSDFGIKDIDSDVLLYLQNPAVIPKTLFNLKKHEPSNKK